MLTRLRSYPSQESATTAGRSHDDLCDTELANLAARGEPSERTSAFAALYRRHVDKVHGYAYRQLGTREAAEDATSDIFRDVAGSLSSFRAVEGKTFRSWLFTIAHHVIADHFARQSRERGRSGPFDPTLPDPSPSPPDLAIAAEEKSWIRTQLAILPPRERQVIELDLVGMKTVEIAGVLGLESGAIHTARCRALNRLQTHLGLKRVTMEKQDVTDSGVES
jgi:RNA polymerase sigma-70 factor (ECF subfamily)